MTHAMLVIAYHPIARREPYREIGADSLDRSPPAATANRLLQRLRQLGDNMTVASASEQAASAQMSSSAT